MTLRVCIFKNCENYINLKDRSLNKDVKLFSFPKNPERRQKWLELGKVSPNQPASSYYFCSDHFDKKYFAVNSIRTILVGEALPYPYVETEIEEIYEDTDSPDNNMELYLHEINRNNDIQAESHQLQDEQYLHVESTTTMLNEQQEEFLEEDYSINMDEQQPDECIIFTDEESSAPQTTKTNDNKRKILQTQAFSSNAKVLKTSPLQKSLRNSLEKPNIKSVEQNAAVSKSPSSLSSIQGVAVAGMELKEGELDSDKLVNAECVTTFIFKGEEYVQMPKNHYLNEKMELIKKLLKLERTIKAIKQQLNSLDI